jgi:Arc/MetJ-type ribon-helix-helix transcriptional regulator
VVFLNVILRGKVKEIVESTVAAGYANTQSEAIRMAIINFGQEHLGEVELVNRKLDFLDQQAKQGKRKLLNAEQALGKYAKHLK